jgi:hypothetical protein
LGKPALKGEYSSSNITLDKYDLRKLLDEYTTGHHIGELA